MISKSSSARRQLLIRALCRYLFSAVFIVIFSNHSLFAQSEIKIAGKVIDGVSGAPVSGAAVSMADYGKSTVTDINGEFRFNDLPSGNYYLKASRIGYMPLGAVELIVNRYSTASITIELTPVPLEVQGQVVSSERPPPFLVTRQGNITVVEVNGDGSASIDELPLQLPEIEIVESGPRKFLRIRGADLNATEIKLNGRTVNSVLSSRGDISAIPFGAVSRIEITTGGNYDSRGLAGSVNFITSPNSENQIISARAEKGSFDREGYSARVSGIEFLKTVLSLDSENLFDRGDFSFTDPRDSTQLRENNYYHDRKLFGVLRHRYGKSSLRFSARFFRRSSGSPGPIFQVTPQAHSIMNEGELMLEISRDIGSYNRISLTSGITNRDIEYNSPRTLYNFIAYNSAFRESSRDIEARYQYKGSLDLDFAGVLRYESLEGEDLIRPDASFGLHSRTTNSVQGGITYRLPQFGGIRNISAATFGYRREGGDGGDFDAPSITFRSGFDIFANPGFDISYSRSRRLPDMTDLFWKEDVFAAPNPDLRPEISDGYEIGADLEFKGVLPTKSRAVRHNRDYEDLIIWRRWAGDKFKPVNLSKAKIGGWEFSLESIPFSGPVTIFWTGSFNKPLNKESEINHYDKYLTFRPIGTQSAGIQFALNGFEIKLTGRHIGARYQTEENTKSLPPVDLVDMRLEYSRSLGKIGITTGFDILNMGDKHYQILDRQPERPREYRLNLKLRNNGGIL